MANVENPVKRSFRAAMRRWCAAHAEAVLDNALKEGGASAIAAVKLAAGYAFGTPPQQIKLQHETGLNVIVDVGTANVGGGSEHAPHNSDNGDEGAGVS